MLLKITKTWEPCKCPTITQLMHYNIPVCYNYITSRYNFEELLEYEKTLIKYQKIKIKV